MCLGFTDRSPGPSSSDTSSSTRAVTERRLPLASASRASRTNAERLDLRRDASSVKTSSSRSGILKDTVFIGTVMYYDLCIIVIHPARAVKFARVVTERENAEAPSGSPKGASMGGWAQRAGW